MKAKEVLEKLQNVFLSQTEEAAPATEEVKEEVKEEVEVQAQPTYVTAAELSAVEDRMMQKFTTMLEALLKDKEDAKEVPAHLSAEDKDIEVALEEAEPAQELKPHPEAEVDKVVLKQVSPYRRMGTKDRVYKRIFG